LHCRNCSPNPVASALVDRFDRLIWAGLDGRMQPNQVDPTLCQEPRVCRKIGFDLPAKWPGLKWLFVPNLGKRAPEPNRHPVAQHELPVTADPQKARFAGCLLVQVAKIQKRIRTEFVSCRVESPSVIGGP